MEDNNTPIVFDNGSGLFKAGFANNESPHIVFKSYIGTPKYIKVHHNKKKDIYIGNEASVRAGLLNLKYPIQHGVVTNWDDLETIWHYAFYNELKINPEEHPILISEVVNNPKSNREKMIQIMFETFHVPSYYTEIDAILSFYSSDCSDGIVLDVGNSVSKIIPFHDYEVIKPAVNRMNIGGQDVTEYLQDLLYQRNYRMTTSAQKDMTCDMKEKICFVKYNHNELRKDLLASYSLPDGTVISIDEERYKCTEILFKTYLNGSDFEFNGLVEMLIDSAKKIEVGKISSACRSIIFSGGSTLFEGFHERIIEEIAHNYLFSDVKSITSLDRKFATWIGGSIVSSLGNFPQMCITKNEYDDAGEQIVHKKCKNINV